jgi:hypothetical protein
MGVAETLRGASDLQQRIRNLSFRRPSGPGLRCTGFSLGTEGIEGVNIHFESSTGRVVSLRLMAVAVAAKFECGLENRASERRRQELGSLNQSEGE